MYMKPLILSLCLLMAYPLLMAQERRKSYLVPSASAFSLGKNEVEVNVFGAYSYNFRAFNFTDAPYRYLDGEFDALNATVQVTYGISNNKNFNIGVDMNQITSIDPGSSGSNASFLRGGPRLRWRPFGALSERFDLTLQHSALFKLTDRDGQFTNDPWFRNQLIISQFFRLDKLRTDVVLQGVGELNVLPRVAWGSMDKKRPLSLPFSILLGIMPNDISVLFASFNYGPEWGTVPWDESDTYYLRRSGTSVSAGMQFTFSRRHSFFLSHNFLLAETRGGGANSFSMGLRFLFIEQY